MAKETRVEESACAVPLFERNRYFYGKPMTVRDFEAEQRYLIGKSHFLNRLLHGSGILTGLQVEVAWNVESQQPSMQISEGAALDCCGNLVVVSRTGPVVVEGDFADGLNYLFIQYAECVKQPIMASTNASSCKEVCCYNRVQETFRVSVTNETPAVTNATLGGSVKENATGRAIHGARVEALRQGMVKAATLTDPQGAYMLRLNQGEYDLRASGSGYNTSVPTGRKISKSSADPLDFKLDPATSNPDAATLCNQLTQNYFEEHLREAPECHDPKVLIAVVEIKAGTIHSGRVDVKTEVVWVNQDETRKYRPVVNRSPMLHDLMCAHVTDFNNPHRTDAAQIRALQSINHVGNSPAGPHRSNVDLTSTDGTLNVAPNATDNESKIDLKLSTDAVTRTHLNADIFNGLIVSRDNAINVAARPADKRIELTMTPPQQVSNVGATGSVGTSKIYAREDHVHKLQINGRGPDVEGNFLLTPGPNAQITQGKNNELIIDAKSGGGGDITTGLLIFGDLKSGEERLSQPLEHGLEAEHVGIILSLEYQTNPAAAVMGDFAEVYPQSPLLIAYTSPSTRKFKVYLKDRHASAIIVPPDVAGTGELPRPPETKPPETPNTTELPGKVERPEESATQPQLPDERQTGRITFTPHLVDTASAEAELPGIKPLEKLSLESTRFELPNVASRAVPGGPPDELRIINPFPVPPDTKRRTYHVRWWAIAHSREMPTQHTSTVLEQPLPSPDEDFGFDQNFPKR
jgi:hypothetical protein